MLSKTHYFIMCFIVVLLASCGEADGGLYGSQCKSIDCSYDTIKCYLYTPPLHGIKISYKRTEINEYSDSAIILCNLEGIDKVEGRRFEGQEFLNRCNIYSPPPGDPWPEFGGNFCEFMKSGDEVGDKMSGKCFFAFVNGYSVTAEFSCMLEAAAH